MLYFLGGDLYFSPERACKCIATCVCVHNICKRHNLVMADDDEIEVDENFNQQLDHAQNNNPHFYNDNAQARVNLINRWFR